MSKEKIVYGLLGAVAAASAGVIVTEALAIKESKKLNALYHEHIELTEQLNQKCTEMYDTAKSLVTVYDALYKIMSYDEEVKDTEQV